MLDFFLSAKPRCCKYVIVMTYTALAPSNYTDKSISSSRVIYILNVCHSKPERNKILYFFSQNCIW